MGVCWVNRRNLLENFLRQGSNALDSSSSPARSSTTEFCQLNGVIIPIGTLAAPSPDEWCRPNAALDVSRPVGTRGGVGWMRGPCAQYISLKALPRAAQRREDQAGRQNRETAPQAQRALVEAPGASWVCICCRPA